MVMTWKYGNIDDDDLRKLEKAFENENLCGDSFLIQCEINMGLDCIRTY